MVKSVRLRDETHTGLKALASYEDTLDDVIQRLIRFYLKKSPAAAKSKGETRQ